MIWYFVDARMMRLHKSERKMDAPPPRVGEVVLFEPGGKKYRVAYVEHTVETGEIVFGCQEVPIVPWS
jgi:hypothetical protein